MDVAAQTPNSSQSIGYAAAGGNNYLTQIHIQTPNCVIASAEIKQPPLGSRILAKGSSHAASDALLDAFITAIKAKYRQSYSFIKIPFDKAVPFSMRKYFTHLVLVDEVKQKKWEEDILRDRETASFYLNRNFNNQYQDEWLERYERIHSQKNTIDTGDDLYQFFLLQLANPQNSTSLPISFC